jgi:hypothetical protein
MTYDEAIEYLDAFGGPGYFGVNEAGRAVKAEVERLRAMCTEAEVTLREVIERYDDELVGSSRGDVDNVRLDLLKAVEKVR